MPEQPTTLDDPPARMDDLQRQVDSLLSRLDAEPVAEGGGDSTAPEQTNARSDARIEALDHQLAALSEELLQQEGDVEIEAAPRSAPPSAGEDSPVENHAGTAHAPQQSVTAEQSAETRTAARSDAPVSTPVTASVPSPVRGVDSREATPRQSRAPFTDSFCNALAGAVEPVARRVSGMPRGVRDSIGWIGVMTLFYAVCVWTVVLVLRGPGGEPPDAPPPEIASAPATPPTDRAGEH
ncbi:MAG: hypothetical protein AMXMBFR77_12820 [Phycisphaerales bacterium]|nr:hypothetical protein [Phycisphaerales bacterium]GIK18900.1 MAG: hypothetical protein BroJett004_10640 [Planctomycetota bacterium]